ncbi:hypothetical protein Tco_1244775 [Tanacetum coccineum]
MSVYTTTQNRKNHVVDSVLDSDDDERVPKFMTPSCATCGNFKHECTCQPVDHMKECHEYLKKIFSKVETRIGDKRGLHPPAQPERVILPPRSEQEKVLLIKTLMDSNFPVEREPVEREPMEREPVERELVEQEHAPAPQAPAPQAPAPQALAPQAPQRYRKLWNKSHPVEREPGEREPVEREPVEQEFVEQEPAPAPQAPAPQAPAPQAPAPQAPAPQALAPQAPQRYRKLLLIQFF